MLPSCVGSYGSKSKGWRTFFFFWCGGSKQVGGVQKTSDFLDSSTWILASLLLILILISNVTLSSGQVVTDSKLLQDEATQQTIPESLPETTNEIPEIPEIPAEIPEDN